MIDFKINWTLKNENVISPVDENILNLIGSYLVMTTILCLSVNWLLLIVFKRHKKLRTPFNKLILVMTWFNLIGVVQLPFIIHSSFAHKWVWTKIGCIFCGYVVYFIGCLQIYLMTAVSYCRYNILIRPYGVQNSIPNKMIKNSLYLSIILSFFWSSAPLFGWSYYSLEDSLVSCSVEYNEKSLNVITYNIGMFIFVFIIPLYVIIFTNIKSILLLKDRRVLAPHIENLKLLHAQKRITQSLFIYILGFLITWTPYGIISMYNAFFKRDPLPMVSAFTGVLAKSSLIWSTVLYMLTNRSIRNRIKPVFFSFKKTFKRRKR